MAYKSRDLSVIAYANGFTLWHYTTTDAAASVDTAGYFNEAADMLRVGDMILANTDTDGTLSSGILHVSSNTGTVVDVDDLTAIGSADTD
ncbi:MAG TPA: hypothetical protein DCL95_14430 [Rhodospirillaceae bacterium]|jgi:hypothetical protein|uniref:hypothetical protein n=1 Tax=unclassified Hwanghaeella TaxID=2605944 RepID=UPI000C38C354|nr:hypothetical protein [Rhodospirillaceae bacterium]MAO92576.1 hypothetical protein [Rhodospirillales bacterium]MAX63485.1 hypothetical protein [Rhodospirillaceae bacterium]MBB56444.1 hypothetical protein [Rhodospirillaceae bacterium]HAE02173.1 hypothetical protein [Rhodospirillaceae bacterium]|tara:strand:+ start:89398 stop:89667 length:270 start_codon:yes stop_codon:yes gene_type:complete